MSDSFPILGEELDVPPTFDEAARRAIRQFQESAARFEALYPAVPQEKYTESEWRVVELAARDIEEAVERAEDAFVAVQYDSHAWYRILDTLETIRLRLDSAVGLMERVRDRP